MNMQWERPDSWTRKLKMSQEQFTPFPCKPKFSDGPFSMTMPHACGEKIGMGSVCNFQVGARTQPWKMDWLDTGQLIRSNKCNVLKWYNDNRHDTAYSGHAKMVATPSFLQTIQQQQHSLSVPSKLGNFWVSFPLKWLSFYIGSPGLTQSSSFTGAWDLLCWDTKGAPP